MLRSIAPELWTADQPLRFLGLELGTRMTVVRLPGRQLFVHSPIARTAALAAELERLGTPTLLVAPNLFHHLRAADWQKAYPTASLLVAPGLERKRPDLRVTGVLGEGSLPAAWQDVLELACIDGFPLVNEVVFFHRPSATLVASDLVFHVGAASPTLTRLVFRAMGAYGRPSATPLERRMIRDRAAFRRSLERILAWPFTRLVIAHGDVIEHDANAALREAYRWLLRPEATGGR